MHHACMVVCESAVLVILLIDLELNAVLFSILSWEAACSGVLSHGCKT